MEWRSAVAPAAVVALAGVLRLTALARTPVDAFYDASVRSMGQSWHAFLVGALDPSARVAIDKPPVDLWLQVASTKLLGFTPLALHLPSAIAGTLTVALLYDLVRTLAGRQAGLCAALALAVLPVAVVTARSDTMDSVMAALVVGAMAVAARAARRGSPGRLALAGALVGLAFEVKLFEALLVAVPLALVWWLGAPLSRGRRTAGLAGAAGACVAVGLAWLVAVDLAVPAGSRPWAYGSTGGSAWNATFVYDGLRRLAGTAVGAAHPTPAQLRRVPAAPGPLRLLSSQAHLGARLGIELVAAWAVAAAVLLTGAWRRLGRVGRAGAVAVGAWLVLGTILFSAQTGLRPRYLEALDPAVAACLGIGLALLVERHAPQRRRGAVVGAAAALVLAAPLAASVAAVQAHVEDAGSPGAPSPARVASLTRYLRAHQGTARDEAASVPVGVAAAVIAHDGRSVLILTGAPGRAIVGAAGLARAVRAGQVHTVLLGRTCGRRPASCGGVGTWVRAHGTDVSHAAGQPAGLVWAVR